MNPKKIIILTANPNNTKPLNLSEEVREIKAAWERSLNREKFEIIVEEAVRPRELRRALLSHKPQIIHFSGHGGGEHGLAFMGDSGEALLVKTEALARFFQVLKNIFPIECVLLNACYSEVQAQGINSYVDYVIGMSQKIGDEAAKQFAIGFYDTLFAGESLENAFDLGCNAIAMENIPEQLTPILKTNTTSETQKAELQDSPTAPEKVIETIILDFTEGSVPLNFSLLS
jgi:hypothetical protein